MKIKDLIKLLEREDGELEIIISSDAEGNNLKRIDELSKSNFALGDDYLEDSLINEDDEPSYLPDECETKVIIWPI